MNDYIEIELTPDRELYYHNDFGVYACSSEQTENIQLNTYGNFVINGVMPRLSIGRIYHASLVETNHKKYGLSYEVKSIKQEIPQTVESQQAFLRSILTENQVGLIINKYPNEDIIEKIKNNTFDYKSIKGIGEFTYLKIKQKIIDNFEIQEALIELSQYGVTYKMIKCMLTHYDNSPSLLVQKVKENPYVLVEVDGLGFLKVDEYALKMGVDKDSPHRLNSAIEFVLQQEESNGHCWIGIENAISKTSEITELSQDTIKKHIMSEDIDDFYLTERIIGLRKNYQYENNIRNDILNLLSNSGNFKVEKIDEKIKSIENEQGFQFTDEQKNAIYQSVKHNVIIISGKAGTGKSTILKGIIKTLGDYTYETCAFSGKASQRIVESTGLKSKTIHRLLEFKPNKGFLYNKGNKLEVDIVVLDEASMVNNNLFYHLVSAIKKGSKLIILGDTEQLPPIGAGCVFKDLIDSGKIPVVELTQVHRQALKSGILLTANFVREGKQINDKDDYETKIVGELKDLYLVPRDEDQSLFDYIVELCEKTKNNINLMDFQVIVPMKARGEISTRNLNIALQEIFNPEIKPTLKRNGYDFKIGDKIIKSGNDYENGVFNGTLGIITSIDDKEKMAGIKFVGIDEEIFYTQEELSQIDMAYALTVHRTQGSQFKHVIVGIDYSAYVLLSRQLIYTALTRASEKCVLVCNNESLRYAISKNDSAKRNTFLCSLLRGEIV